MGGDEMDGESRSRLSQSISTEQRWAGSHERGDEMIAGTLVLEDKVLHFRAAPGGRVKYAVADQMSGKEETVIGSFEHFVDALNIALRMDGAPTQEPIQTQWDHAEEVMPEDPTLRWIP